MLYQHIFTNFKTFQVVNYGIGGQYAPHLDFTMVSCLTGELYLLLVLTQSLNCSITMHQNQTKLMSEHL